MITEYLIRHRLTCKECKADLTVPNSIDVHFSVCGEEFYRPSSVNELGILRDVDGGLVKKGFHAGSCCQSCGEELEDELTDSDSLFRENLELTAKLEDMFRLVSSEGVKEVIASLIPIRDAVEHGQGNVIHQGNLKKALRETVDTLYLLSRENSELVEKLEKLKPAILPEIQDIAKKLKRVAMIIENTRCNQIDAHVSLNQINDILFGHGVDDAQERLDQIAGD